MSTLEQLRKASQKAQEIVASFQNKLVGAVDATEERVTQLEAMTKKDLVALVVALEKPKTERAFKSEDVVKSILEDADCACLNYEQVASIVHMVLPDGKTSAKTVASYASKHKEDWAIVKRAKINLSVGELTALAVNG